MKIIKYGLRKKGSKDLLGYDFSSNDDGEFCGSETYYLTENFGENKWLVDSPEHAEYVRLHSTEWYNASLSTPENPYIKEKCDIEVVKVEIEEHVEVVDVKIPEEKEVYETLYAKDNPGHLQYILGLMEKNKTSGLSFGDLIHYYNKKGIQVS